MIIGKIHILPFETFRHTQGRMERKAEHIGGAARRTPAKGYRDYSQVTAKVIHFTTPVIWASAR
ncbi:hypothetical protein GCM10007898_26630 [Dyella flagellata]|uniref:Uncharacterized protein n=1 Tax=Dyella flagellata TaxID=1867833 RepID=A0ABQ5XEL5_9GAMM|nr:hypothetical protein GCM10007898_26630 [Dyella flagellata]